MITGGKKWHYLTVKTSVLLRGVTSKHVGDFYCLNCFHILQKKKLKKHYNVCKNHDYCYVEVHKKIIKYWNTTIEKS